MKIGAPFSGGGIGLQHGADLARKCKSAFVQCNIID
jgi:hypothetical protein